jgi:hypothetical protein
MLIDPQAIGIATSHNFDAPRSKFRGWQQTQFPNARQVPTISKVKKPAGHRLQSPDEVVDIRHATKS